jgi:AcrR family transcriptional regulator
MPVKPTPGRPRDATLDGAITAAACALLLGEGHGAVTIDRVARNAGTTRAAVYRRYATRGEIVLSLLVDRFGVDPAPNTGSLRGDLLELQHRQVEFFADPVVEAALAGTLRDIIAEPQLSTAFHERFMAPRRRSVAAMLDRARARGEIAAGIDPGVISDVLTGPLLLRSLLPALGEPDEILVQATVTAAIAILEGGE